MTTTTNPKRSTPMAALAIRVTSFALASATMLGVAACRPDDPGTRVAGWSIVDPTQRHPILVAQEPHVMKVRVSRGSYGLSPQQRAQAIGFLERYRAGDAGNSKLVISAPSGSSNEVAAMQAVAELRHLMREAGFDESSIMVEAYQDGGGDAPVRVSYLRYVAHGPECGQWPTNLAYQPNNLAYPNLGCSTQKNLAAMIANPADLLGPRSSTARSGERRDVMWEKYQKGDSTVSRKTDDERVKVKGAE